MVLSYNRLVKVNGKCGPSKRLMVLGSNPTNDDTLNLSSVDCCWVVSIPRFGFPWRVIRAWP